MDYLASDSVTFVKKENVNRIHAGKKNLACILFNDKAESGGGGVPR